MNEALDEFAKNDIFTQGLFCCRAADFCINTKNGFSFTKRKIGNLALEFGKEVYIFHDPYFVNYNLKDESLHVEAPPYESSSEPAIVYVVFLLDNKERKRFLDKIYVEDFFHKRPNQSLSHPHIETLEEHGIHSNICNSIIVDVNPMLLQYGTSKRGLSQFL